MGLNVVCTAPPCCKPCPEAPAPLLCCRFKMKLMAGMEGVSFPPVVCGGISDMRHLEAWVRRRGECRWVLRYPAWDVTDRGDVVFRFDDQFKELSKGRYEFEIRHNGAHVGSVDVDIGALPTLDTKRFGVVSGRKYNYLGRPAGINTMSIPLCVEQVDTALCGILERGDMVIPLDGLSTERICSCTVCRPWDIVLDDGVNQEIVRFLGCTDGTPRWDRPGPQFRFPVGTSVRFSWTANNVLAVQAGCP